VSQDFEDVSSLNDSVESGRMRSFSLPPQISNDLNKSWANRRPETYFEMFKDMGTNLKYKMGFIGLGQSIWLKDVENVKKAYLLGEEYDINVDGEEKQDQLQKMKKAYSEIIWFSYRKNFPKLNHHQLPDEESYISDTGWGCTIRSCQMMFAQCLKKSLISNSKHSKNKKKMENMENNGESTHERLPGSEKALNDRRNYKIISWFLDCQVNAKRAPYSIQSLSSYIYENFHIGPGNWLKPSTVLFALQNTHQTYRNSTVPKFQVEIFIEGTIYIDQVVNKVGIPISPEEESLADEIQKEFEVISDDGQDDSISETKSVHSQLSERHRPKKKRMHILFCFRKILKK
jgi:hypothetical protein